MSGFVQVSEDEHEEVMEIPLEADGTLSLATLTAQFPGACGLKYRVPESRAMRGVRLSNGNLLPPDEGWVFSFICSFPKENKRKIDDQVDAAPISKKRMEGRKCVDLIVLGLPWKTTEDELKSYFEKYGDLVMTQIKKDPRTGKSKGFGFIRFASYESQRRAVLQKHNIDGRHCEVRIPNSKEGAVPSHNGKIFVGRLSENIGADDLEKHFSNYGEVVDVFVPRPFRGFGFVTFLDPEVVETLYGEDHIVKGVSLHVSDAVPKSETSQGRGGAMSRRNDSYDNYDSQDRGSNWDSPGFSGNWNNSGSDWQSGSNGSSSAGPMDWNKMTGGMNSLAMPMLAALGQASMEILGSMQGGQIPPENYHGNKGGNWKQNNWDNQSGGRGYNRN